MFKKALIFLTVLLILSCFYQMIHTHPFKNYKKINIRLGNERFDLFIADNSEKKQRGLSDINSLGNNQGMLFIFEKPDYYSFWMKDMRFALDFIFVKDGEIVDLIENVKPDSFPNIFISKKSADKVIEVKAGMIKDLKIKIGGQINF